MTEYLTDGTWRQLDPYAGRLSRRQLALVWVAALVAVLVLVSGAAAVRSGLLTPNLARGNAWAFGFDADQQTFYYGFELVNRGSFTVEITGAGGGPIPGLEPIALPQNTGGGGVSRGDEFGPLEPGRRMWIAVAYRVTDCATVPVEPLPVGVHVARPWGTYTSWHQPARSGFADDDWEDEAEDFTEPQSGPAWQRSLADQVC